MSGEHLRHSAPDEWTLDRALRLAEKHRERWPAVPDEKGRVPGVGYWATTILAARIAELEEQMEALERIAPIGRESEMEMAQRRRADALQEQLEARDRERDEETQRFLTRTTELKEQYEGEQARAKWLQRVVEEGEGTERRLREQLEAAERDRAEQENAARAWQELYAGLGERLEQLETLRETVRQIQRANGEIASAADSYEVIEGLCRDALNPAETRNEAGPYMPSNAPNPTRIEVEVELRKAAYRRIDALQEQLEGVARELEDFRHSSDQSLVDVARTARATASAEAEIANEYHAALTGIKEQLQDASRKLAREQARKRHYTDALQKIVDVPSGEFLVGVRRREGAEFMRELARDALGLGAKSTEVSMSAPEDSYPAREPSDD